jgi:hypothetical protein
MPLTQRAHRMIPLLLLPDPELFTEPARGLPVAVAELSARRAFDVGVAGTIRLREDIVHLPAALPRK